MATTSSGLRELKSSVRKSSIKKDFPFGVNRGPVSAQNRDVAEFEDYRHRSFVERMKDAFRTISFRSEPTIGEEDLRRCCNVQTHNATHNGQIVCGTVSPVAEKKRQELIQSLVPDCYEHIQNFHHYRTDMERLSSGVKVEYLSANDSLGKGENVLRRVYGQNATKSDKWGPKMRQYGFRKPRHFRMPRDTISTNVTMVRKKSFTHVQKNTAKPRRNTNRNDRSNCKQTLDCSRELSIGKDSKRCSGHSTNLSLNNVDKCLSFQEEHSVTASGRRPSFKLEQAASDNQTADIQRSSHSLGSDLFPKPPMTTPNDMSRRSSVRTLLFDSEEDKSDRHPTSPRNSPNNHSPHYLAPFQSRFPHLKSSESTSSSQMRQNKGGKATVPPWQQYRILCDAFRPAISPEKLPSQHGYRKPKYATATELGYYIDIVSETNSNSSMYLL